MARVARAVNHVPFYNRMPGWRGDVVKSRYWGRPKR
jgi:hypothetical protein